MPHFQGVGIKPLPQFSVWKHIFLVAYQLFIFVYCLILFFIIKTDLTNGNESFPVKGTANCGSAPWNHNIIAPLLCKVSVYFVNLSHC